MYMILETSAHTHTDRVSSAPGKTRRPSNLTTHWSPYYSSFTSGNFDIWREQRKGWIWGPLPGTLLFMSVLFVENKYGRRQIEIRVNMGEKRTEIKNIKALSLGKYCLSH